MPEKLRTYLDREYLGEITLEGENERYGLEYAHSWIASGGFPVSPHLSFTRSPPESVRRFLANLLPEGKWLEELALTTHVSRSNTFGLIAAMGAETAGALSFRPGKGDGAGYPTSFRPIAPDELNERIARRRDASIAVWDGKPRLSIAGVQDKLPILIMRDGAMGFGEGELASTHILKFGTAPDMHLVVNEFICMELARRAGLAVARVSLARMGEPVLIVKRFDREWGGERLVRRRHLIDGCQILDLPPTYKYERPFGKSGHAAVIRGGASLPALFEACRLCTIPALAMRDLLNWVLFQLLIGNSDAHGKNISFHIGAGGISPAPAYDLVCLDIYGERYDRDLAMAVGDTFNPDEVFPWQLAEMCEACRLPKRQTARMLTLLCTNLRGELEDFEPAPDLTDDESAFAQSLIARIGGNVRRYLEYARELPRVAL